MSLVGNDYYADQDVTYFQMASLGTAIIGNALSYTSAEIAFLPW